MSAYGSDFTLQAMASRTARLRKRVVGRHVFTAKRVAAAVFTALILVAHDAWCGRFAALTPEAAIPPPPPP